MLANKKFISLCMGAVALLAAQAPVFAEEAKAPEKKQPAAEKKLSPTDPVAKVNGSAITRKDLDRAVKVLMAQNRLPGTLPAEQQKEAENAALDQLVAAELLYQAGQKTETKDLNKQIEEKISQNKAKFPTADEFEKALKSVEMSENDLKEFTRKDIIITSFIEKNVVSKVAITDADAKKFYDENTDKFKQEETVRASHILISADASAGEDVKKKAREKAEGILKKVKGGEDFAALAKAESTCPSGKQGGDLGFFRKGQMVPAFEEAAFSLKPGGISGVVETQFGYHVIKVTEKKEAGSVKFDEVKAKIIDYLKSQQIQKGVAAQLDELKSKAKIERM